MALTWILVFIVVELFSESTCTLPVKPICGDLSLQYFFFLVPPSSELENVKKFLANIESATIFDTPEDGNMVQVICDPKDREKIYGYTKDRNIYFIQSTYCVEKSQFSALQELRLRRNKLRKLMINEAPNNWLDKEIAGQGKSIAIGKDSLKELNGKVLKVLKNGRILKTRAIRYAVKKKGNKNRSMKTTKKDENCTPSSPKSIKKQTSTGRVKTNPRRSINTETEGSTWIENTFQRMKRYSWDILMKNYNSENGHDNGDISLNQRKIRSLTIPSRKKSIFSKPHRQETDNGKSTVPSSGDSDNTESTGTTDGISTTTIEVTSQTTTDTIEESTDEIVVAGEEGKRSKNRGSRDIGSLELEIERKLVKRSKFSSITHKHDTTENSSAKNDNSKNDDIECVTVARSSLVGKLADYIDKIFKWVKNLKIRERKLLTVTMDISNWGIEARRLLCAHPSRLKQYEN